MTTADDYETALLAADRALKSATSAEDVRRTWKAHMGTLGHRTLGRLLIGQDVGRLLERHELRSTGE